MILTTAKDKISTSLNVSLADAFVVSKNDPNIFVAGIVENNTYRADYINNGISSKDFYKDFGVLYRMIGRAIDLGISKVTMAVEPWTEDSIFKQHLTKQNGLYVYDIEQRHNEINEFAMTHNILPFGSYESLPVTHTYGLEPEKYGCVVELNIEPIDPEELRNACNSYAGSEQPHYVSDRFNEYLIPAPETINYLRYVGFTTEKYASYPMNIKGTATLDPTVPEYVKETYSKIEAPIFRHNYVIARNGWETTWHKDHATPVQHGFRLMIPIDPVIMDFEKGRYVLTPGKYYFVNNSLLHKGIIPMDRNNRSNLMGQLASDVDILKGKIVF